MSLGAIAHPTLDTTRVRLTEHTSSTERLDPRMIACLGVVKTKGRRRQQGNKQEAVFKRGRAVNTKWGPGILKAKCVGGWNVDFRDGHPGGWFVDMKDFS